ncbi:MAG: RHS repeat-associated core domain-containing protein, partial [Dokdonella sp.]
MTANGPGATNYAYTADGNLTYKSDYGVEHQYGGAGCPGRPHFVTQVTKGDTGPNGTDTFTCDANGNVNGGNSLTAAVYDFQNQARRLQRYATGSSDFRYGADGNRYMEVSLSGSSSLTTRFGPRGYEKSSDNTSTTLRHELGPVTVRQTDGGSFVPVAQLRDRLGSTLAQASATGSATNKRGYDSFGEVTNGDFSPRQPAVLGLAPTTLRGFTGHEHLDAVRLIHMNGRIYDPKLGRFYSVDPVIQFPSNSQSLNPYSYILNNPLSGRDPSGYMSQLDMRTNRIIANANNNCMGGVLCIAASEKAFLAGPRSNLAGMTSGGA